MRKRFLIPILVGLLAVSATQAFAQSATVVLRNGDRIQAEVRDMGRALNLRVNGAPRAVPITDVVMIDFTGDGRINNDEQNRANSANGFVVMRSGESFDARLQDLMGNPLVAAFSNGRRVNLGEVSRVYFGGGNAAAVPGTPASPTGNTDRPSVAPARARSVVVPGNVQWTNTGLSVSRGQSLRFEPSGEIRLSFNGDDIARPAGAMSFRHSDKAPIATIPAGALIGRINNGRPFSIGDPNQAFDMPENGRLFLGVNDDHVADNSGNFVVRIWEP